jgi:hypothetical protein
MMPSDRYLRHVTLTTGHVRDSRRDEVHDDVIAALVPLLDRALTGEHVPIPGATACTLTGGVHGRCVALTVWGPPVDGHAVPIVTIGVATHSRCGAHLWRSLHARSSIHTPVVTLVDQVPPEPWCAALLEPGSLIYPEAMGWLGDLERCLAWAWLERYEAMQ